MNKTLIALGLALAFSQGAVAAQAELAAEDAAAVVAAIQVLGEEDLTAAFGAGETDEIAVLSDEEMVETTGAKAKTSVAKKIAEAAKKAASKAKTAGAVTKAVVKANIGTANDKDYALINKHDATLTKVQKGAKVVVVGSAIAGAGVAAAIVAPAVAPAAIAAAKLKAIQIAGAAVASPVVTTSTVRGVVTLANVGKNALDQYKTTGKIDPGKLSQPLISGGFGVVRTLSGAK
ncbi:MAG: hypothetical protein HY778_09065 [Betaproteobacteria bacterium]|nr:hypothetical protein [Betaproteobacteria bacterium]